MVVKELVVVDAVSLSDSSSKLDNELASDNGAVVSPAKELDLVDVLLLLGSRSSAPSSL